MTQFNVYRIGPEIKLDLTFTVLSTAPENNLPLETASAVTLP